MTVDLPILSSQNTASGCIPNPPEQAPTVRCQTAGTAEPSLNVFPNKIKSTTLDLLHHLECIIKVIRPGDPWPDPRSARHRSIGSLLNRL
jgi:hypothetical protein